MCLVFSALWSHLNIYNKFYFGFIFCNEVIWDNEAFTGGLESWLTCGSHLFLPPTSLERFLAAPSPALLPPFVSGVARAWGQGVGSASGTCARCWEQERAQAPVKISFHLADIS